MGYIVAWRSLKKRCRTHPAGPPEADGAIPCHLPQDWGIKGVDWVFFSTLIVVE